MTFSYASEKFSTARSLLMLPHPQGEDRSIAEAFFECSLGLTDIDRDQLDDDSRAWVEELDGLMSTEGVLDPKQEGAYLVKAREFTLDDRYRVSHLVDTLHYWFNQKRP
ncbi:hypothetical protein HX866_07450 [Pseudomonas gingeri]|uniref:hypothetical protein n=1 Tax=Pseudomonas gingeri TaxID=117681 RepID=UPI0015A14518|nr:hypothetical protein [Pseudomonas gingeri]NWA24721.1 hypothetical protein [Pseudomonas gingeri]